MKKIPVKFQLAILLAIPIIVFYAVFIVTYILNYNTQRDLKELLYEQAYQGSTSLIEADRDMYQARLSVVQMLSSDSVDKLNAEKDIYSENIQQVTERLQSASELLQNAPTLDSLKHEESGKSIAQNLEEFETNFDEWHSGVDAIVAQLDSSSSANRPQSFATLLALNEKFEIAHTNIDEINQLINIHVSQQPAT